ncbi:carbonic anhydrase [Thermosulfurimonas dismutans]|uniref:Carbonic anhydrase n=1 Tax=Thermosulfurimonas dismutans TaxID=999894 RepID=A0A179D828_9BACT|nr:carbonic anhydrase family protein [Thermosulfurimonas dismutans]OAQ21602.1 Carbonic anhydrase [Thermosulfurimonas dismutans]
MKKFIGGLVGSLMIGGVALAGGGHVVKWGYVGKIGPAHWGDLAHEYFMCKVGKNQSPVDINSSVTIEAQLEPINFHYRDQISGEIVNNGHTIMVVPKEDNYIVVDGKKFHLKQFHFHSPSEHTVEGKYYLLELHFVHQADDGQLAVIGVVFDRGAEHPEIAKLWKEAPEHEGKKELKSLVNMQALLPENLDYYRYSGSLTTPPCSEGVIWLFLKNPLQISEAQAEKFKKIMGFENNRPVQPVNARKILK